MNEVLFPYKEVRPIQKALTIQILNTIKNKQDLVAHAPVGLGKTAAALSSALTYAIDKNKTVFFLTPMHSQHTIAIDTLKEIKNKFKKDIQVIDLIGKKWMCLVPGADQLSSGEFSEYCKEVTKNKTCEYCENIKNPSLKNLCIEQIKDPMHVEELIEHSKQHKMCPFEITTELGKKAKVIIADYYHILHPSIRKHLLKRMNKTLENSILIFDEAHTLIQKCRDLLTWNLSTITINKAIKESKEFNFGFEDDLEELHTQIEKIKKDLKITDQEILVKQNKFIFDKILIKNFRTASELVLEEKKRSFISSVANFMEAWIDPKEHGFMRLLKREFTRQKHPYLTLSYKCLDPSLLFNQLEAHSKILMSGTLNPPEMYRDLLQLKPNTTILAEYLNPFPKINQLNFIVPLTSTKYNQRSKEMYQKIAHITSTISNKIPGNTIIFFPSYDLRDKVNEHFKELCEKTTFLESNKMSKQEKKELLERFKKYNKEGAVMLAAASGSLGTGIDLPGDLLKCVIVVGLPLAKPNLETQELIKYYDKLFNKGWDYAYIYPAIIQSLQNAGRCIRSATDKGVIVLLDERYAWKNFRKCFPPNMQFDVSRNPMEQIEEFFIGQ